MIRIVEGTDGTGKSTYAASLLRLGDALLHYDKPEPGMDWREEYCTRVLKWSRDPLTLAPVDVVLDRSFIGSRIWSALGFHDPTLTEDEWNVVCSWYARRGSEVRVIIDEWHRVYTVLEDRGEAGAQAAHVGRGQHEYLRLLDRGDVLYMPIGAWTANRVRRDEEWN